MDLDLRDRAHPHDRIGVEVLGNDVAAVAEDDLAPGCGAQAPEQPAFHLRADEVGVDVSPAVECEHDSIDMDAATLVERDLRDLGAVAEKAGAGDPARSSFGKWCPPISPLGR